MKKLGFLLYAFLCAVVMMLSNYMPGNFAEGAAVTPEPTPTPYSGVLYLTVSELTFSVVGESEDIYWGTLPREAVSWESADPSVISVENGIVTALAVGTTTISCEYNGERLECTVGCLAENEKALKKVKDEILRSPKRVPPFVSDEPSTCFSDAAIVGDSISYVLWQQETANNLLGDVKFFTRGGISLNGLEKNFKNIYFKGKDRPLEEIIEISGVKRIYLMAGQNDLRYRSVDKTLESLDILLQRILEKNPDVEICLESLIPEWDPTWDDNSKNVKIEEYNDRLRAYAAEHGYMFVEVGRYAVDHVGKMPNDYALDRTIHMNDKGCYQWMQLLKSYVYLEENEGE